MLFRSSDDDARAISAFVMGEVTDIKTTRFPSDVGRGKELFVAHCSVCHGENGKGMEGVADFAPDLSKYGTTAFLKIVLGHGKKGMIGQMPSFNYANFNDTQIDALSNYIRSIQSLDVD